MARRNPLTDRSALVNERMEDSPAGLAAWILVKWRYWADTRGNLDERFSRDLLVTTVTLYWVTLWLRGLDGLIAAADNRRDPDPVYGQIPTRAETLRWLDRPATR